LDDFELEIKKEFLNEALMNLEEVEGSFMELESASDTKPLLDKIFRLAHNLKGGSRAVGFGDVAEFTHQLESLVLKIQKDEIGLCSELITTLLQSNDRLVEMLSKLKEDLAATFDNSDILVDLQAWISGSKTSAPTSDKDKSFNSEIANHIAGEIPTDYVESLVTETQSEINIPDSNAFFIPEFEGTELASIEASPVEAPIEPKETDIIHSEKVEAQPLPASAEVPNRKANTIKESGVKEDEIIRVNLSRIDLLNDYVGELIVLQSVVQQQSSSNQGTKLQASIRQMMKLSKDIQSLSMGLRMLPVKPLIQKLQRVVRDTAKTLNKEVSLQVHGEQMDIDKSVLDRLADPLIHILRNAVDHGLESPEDRKQLGKTAQGHVVLSFLNEGNHLVVEVKDDGKGINGEILRKKAIEKKVIAESQSLTEKQLIHLIFHPGFSTKTETSEVSGRGVGMDVVKTNVEKIGGQVDVTTTIGAGSHFRLQIPLSLAVIEGLVVTTELNRYVVPLSQVQETINLKSQKVYSGKLGIGSCIKLRGEVVPLFSLEESLGTRGQSKFDGTALIINVGDRPMALVVNDILRAQQIVIKPFSNGILPQKGWIGSCVLGDGLPTLIISPVDLLQGKVTDGLGDLAMSGAA
jgi:two-component system, chemotaxis family, sensor kinase CheA